MHTPEAGEGWAWFETQAGSSKIPEELCRAAHTALATPQGELVLAHLRRLFLDRRLPPSASDAELRHVEGQRSVVAHLLALLERAREGA